MPILACPSIRKPSREPRRFDPSLWMLVGADPYRVEILGTEDDSIAQAIRITSPAGKEYDLSHDQDIHMNSCDCGDYTFRHAGTRGECKHIKAAVRLGLLYPQRPELTRAAKGVISSHAHS